MSEAGASNKERQMSDIACAGKRFLVTGGAGFIGSHLVDSLLERGAAKVVVVDTFFLGKEENLRDARAKHGDKLVVYREDAGDLVAMTSICDEHKPEFVFNLATKALKYSFFNPPGACRVNLDIALALGELMRLGRVKRLLHLSSSEVYGTAQKVPMSEEHPLLAETTYAAGKAAGDIALAAYARTYNLDITTLRPFNNYGPRQNDLAFAGVVPITVRRIQEGKKPLIEGDGEQTRDFIFVKDTVSVILRAAFSTQLRGQVLNAGSGKETSIKEMVKAIARAMNYDGEFESAPARTADVRRHCADVSKAKAVLGDISVTPLDAGIAETVKWYLGEEKKFQ